MTEELPVPKAMIGAIPWLDSEFIRWFREEAPKLPPPPPEFYEYVRTAPLEDLLNDLLDKSPP